MWAANLYFFHGTHRLQFIFNYTFHFFGEIIITIMLLFGPFFDIFSHQFMFLFYDISSLFPQKKNLFVCDFPCRYISSAMEWSYFYAE